MDVMKSETSGMQPDTVLWFVFLLDPSLLEKHLNEKDADPPPTELIIKFLVNGAHIQEPHATNKKYQALKILSLKVAAFLKWDMTVLQSKLPLGMQRLLLNDLLYMTLQVEPNPTKHSELNFDEVAPQVLFSVVLFHRWIVRALVKQNTTVNGNGNGSNNSNNNNSTRTPPGSSINGVGPNEVFSLPSDEILRMLEKQAVESVALLQRAVVAEPALVTIPTFETFQPLTEDNPDLNLDWKKCLEISLDEFRCQIHFDLGIYFIFRQENSMAREHFSACTNLFTRLNAEEMNYCTVSLSELNGYRLACGLLISSQPSLLCQFHAAIKQQYMGIVNILATDNRVIEIPMVHREHLELDIQGAVQSGKFTVARDLLLHVQCLNMARRLKLGNLICQTYIPRIRAAGAKGADIVVSSLKPVVQEADKLTSAERSACLLRVKTFITDLLEAESTLYKAVQSAPELCTLFTPEELNKLSGKSSELTPPAMPSCIAWDLPDLGPRQNPRLELGAFEQQLIQSYDPKEIRQLFNSISISKPHSKSLWTINSKWELPIPLHSVVMSLPPGFLQDFCYILLAKAHELASVQEYRPALTLYSVVESELKEVTSVSPASIFKLVRLCEWEALIVEITQFIDEWPVHKDRLPELLEACRSCLTSRQAGETLIPRLEVVERCAVFILNAGNSSTAIGSPLDFLTNIERNCSHVELAAAFAFACQDVVRHKGGRHVSRDAWDLVLPVFLNGGTKRNNSGMPIHHAHRDSPVGSGGICVSNLWAFLSQLREPTVITLAISLLARIYNVLRDDSKLDINADFVSLWPGAITNPNSYLIRPVSELLYQLLGQALRYNPNNVGLLKVLGDLNFVMGHHSSALKAYLEAAIAATDFFTQQLPKSQIDDQVIRRMIRCCSALQCHTQAAVLCQFLDEVDYTTAFKSLGETKGGSCADAMDSYYGCVWDSTLLEFLVHLHTKRGEFHRKQLAIQTIGLLELNSNNNEEIQREAANIRKARFLRALAHQYVC